MGYLTLGLLLVSLSVVSLAYGSELLTLFFGISGLTLLWEAYKKSALIVSVDGVEFKVILRGRKPPFEVILLRDGDVVWRGEIRDSRWRASHLTSSTENCSLKSGEENTPFRRWYEWPSRRFTSETKGSGRSLSYI
ncbi:hypothetical protein [Thermococcus sp.]